MEMTEAPKHALPDRLTEAGALTVAAPMKNAYERHQHERLSQKLGFGKSWIAAVNGADPGAATELAEDERAVARLAIALVRDRGLGDGTRAALAETVRLIGPEQAIAVLFLVGRYVTHAYVVNALGLAPRARSPRRNRRWSKRPIFDRTTSPTRMRGDCLKS